MVLLAMPRSSIAVSSLPTSPSCSIMPSAYSLPGMPLCPRIDSRTWVNACMRVVFIQVKNGFFGPALPLHEVNGGGSRLVVDRLHPLSVERAGVFDLAVRGRLEH